MRNPRFSVVIPTRERANTLRYTLSTCLDQTFDDYEIIVCDNCSSPETKAVVDSFASPRIVYHRSPKRLCMGDNWNLAYGLTRGEYVTFIGDDDGLMPYAFSQIDGLIRAHGLKALTWSCGVYSWPNVPRRDLANYLQLCTLRKQNWFEGRQAIKDAISGRLAAPILPNIYHGLVAREILEKIRNRAGYVFAGYAPDTYTNFAVAYLVERYLHVSVPMSLSGFSGSSNNVAFGFMRGKHQNIRLFRAENAASGVELHPWAPDLPSGWVVVVDSFLTAKRDLFPDDSTLTLDRKLVAETLLERMPIDDVSEWPDAVAEIRRSLSDDAELTAWFDERVRQTEPKAPPPETYRAPVEGLSGGYLHLDTSKYRVDDVAAAVRLATKILGYGRKPIGWDFEDASKGGRLRRLLERWRLAAILAMNRRRGRLSPQI
jgi:glycosyltransferase involved in cell wall biosynthesis